MGWGEGATATATATTGILRFTQNDKPGTSKGRRRLPSGMTTRTAKATAKATTEILRFAQNDGAEVDDRKG